MEYKPWPLIILAFFHFIEPLTKISFYSAYFSVNPVDVVLIEYQASSTLQFFEYFFLFPIAGIAIFAVKKWSFPVFLIIEAWVLITNIPYFNELYLTSQFLLLGFFILFGILNITVVSYLLLPAVRIAYLDPRIRWWEAKPRYSVDIECKVNDKPIGRIKNLSESGVFISTHEDLPIDSIIKLEYTLETVDSNAIKICTQAHIIHKFTINSSEGYGIQYTDLPHSTKHFIHSKIKYLEKAGYDRRPPRRHITDLFNWLAKLIKTGEGLLPKNRANTVF